MPPQSIRSSQSQRVFTVYKRKGGGVEGNFDRPKAVRVLRRQYCLAWRTRIMALRKRVALSAYKRHQNDAKWRERDGKRTQFGWILLGFANLLR